MVTVSNLKLIFSLFYSKNNSTVYFVNADMFTVFVKRGKTLENILDKKTKNN